MDHIVPKTRGGLDDPINLVEACDPCNTRKANLLPLEFVQVLRFSSKPRAGDKELVRRLETLWKSRPELVVLMPEIKPLPLYKPGRRRLSNDQPRERIVCGICKLSEAFHTKADYPLCAECYEAVKGLYLKREIEVAFAAIRVSRCEL